MSQFCTKISLPHKLHSFASSMHETTISSELKVSGPTHHRSCDIGQPEKVEI